jgi:hypothetical protein
LTAVRRKASEEEAATLENRYLLVNRRGVQEQLAAAEPPRTAFCADRLY